jgi:hypothetical protein
MKLLKTIPKTVTGNKTIDKNIRADAMSKLDWRVFPCSAKNLIREEFNPKLRKTLTFPISKRRAKTPYNSSPSLCMKTGIVINIKIEFNII